MIRRIDVPTLVRQRAESHGADSRRWLDDLPDLIASLAERWALQLGHALDGGTASYVTTAIDRAGQECVLKVAMLLDDEDRVAFDRSVLVHQIAGGRGCAELLDHDVAAPAMLLERLGPNLHDLGLTVPEVLDAVADTSRTFWRPVGSEVALPTGAEKAAWLARYIAATWQELGEPCDRSVVDRAIALCDERAAAFDPERAILVHGDAHGWNTVEAGGGTFKFVDPEGLRAEPEQDLAVPMREYNEPLLAGDTSRLVHERAEHLAVRCDADAVAVWQWGFIERVSTGLSSLQHFDQGSGHDFLEVGAAGASELVD